MHTTVSKLASAKSLTFDQLKQDQTIALQYIEDDGTRSAGLSILDQPSWSLAESVQAIERAEKMPAGPAKDAAQAELAKREEAGDFGVSRLLVGKNRKAASTLELKDGRGRPRLRLSVAVDGAAAIELLDEQGAVTRRL